MKTYGFYEVSCGQSFQEIREANTVDIKIVLANSLTEACDIYRENHI